MTEINWIKIAPNLEIDPSEIRSFTDLGFWDDASSFKMIWINIRMKDGTELSSEFMPRADARALLGRLEKATNLKGSKRLVLSAQERMVKQARGVRWRPPTDEEAADHKMRMGL